MLYFIPSDDDHSKTSDPDQPNWRYKQNGRQRIIVTRSEHANWWIVRWHSSRWRTCLCCVQHTENESGMTRTQQVMEIGILARTRCRVETDQGGMHITLSRYTYRHQVHSTLSTHLIFFFMELFPSTELCVCVCLNDASAYSILALLARLFALPSESRVIFGLTIQCKALLWAFW